MTWATCVLIGTLAFVHIFITYRGQVSAAAMDQAQVARELAKGHLFQTKIIRPSSITQAATRGVPVRLDAMPETLHPPLQSLVWAPVFKALQDSWTFTPGRSIFILDRVMACMGVAFFILTLVLMHGMARRLFDRTVAGLSVLALALSEPMWQLATNGGARVLLMLLTTLALYWLTLLVRRDKAGEPLGAGLQLALALVLGLLVLTHWGAVWIVAGLLLAFAVLVPTHRGSLLLLALVPMLCGGAWMWHNKDVCGDYLGAAKPMLQGLLSGQSEAQRLRDFEDAAPPVYLPGLVRRLALNSLVQVQDLFAHLGFVLPALFFLGSLLHRFRRPEAGAVRTALLLVWGAAFFGMSLLGVPDKFADDNQLHSALVPALTVFGMAGLAVFWARLSPGSGGLWTMHGYALIALGITGWSMLTSLSNDLRIGLFYRDQLQQWPPYNAVSTHELSKAVKPHQLLVSDAPWTVAWYADRSCLWLPRTRPQLNKIRDLATQQKTPVVGIVITPLATKGTDVASILAGPYGEWGDVLFRGPLMAFGSLDLIKITKSDFPFSDGFPLGYLSGVDGSRIPAMMFYMDKALLEK